MFILDTNVASELIKPRGDQMALSWFAAQKRRSLYTTVITVAEMQFGIFRLPVGRKRQDLQHNFDKLLDTIFKDKVLVFDTASAHLFASLRYQTTQQGFTITLLDLQIAAIANMYNATLITRNMKDFAPCGIQLINPWDTNA